MPRAILGKMLGGGGGVSVLEVHRQDLSVLVVICKQCLLANPSGTDSLSQGLQGHLSVCPKSALQQKCLPQGVLQAKLVGHALQVEVFVRRFVQNLSVLGVEHGS